MAMTYASITGRVTLPGTDIGIRCRIEAHPMTADEILTFPVEDRWTQGPVVGYSKATDGTIDPAMLIPIAEGADGVSWRFVFTPLDRVNDGKKLGTWTRTYAITASARIEDLVETVALAVTPELVASIESMVEAAELAESDAEGAALAAGASETAAAASATAAQTAQTGAETARDTAEDFALGFTAGTATPLAPGASPTLDITGPAGAKVLDLGIPAGLADDASMTAVAENPASDFSGALSATIATSGHDVPAWAPTTAYVQGQQVLNPSGQVVAAKVAFTSGATYNAANWNASSTLVVRAKDVMGGQHLAPVRVPQLSVVESWPNPVAPFLRLMWTESNGATIYAYDRGRSIWKSTDSGRTYTRTGSSKVGVTSIQFGTVFWKTTAGSLLAFRFDFDQMYRSTDDGATWTSVHTLPFKQLLGPQSICQDLVTGYLYYAEYPTLTGLTSPTCKVWRSTDDGVTWTVFYTFNTSGAGAIDHIHSIQWDHVAQRVVISAGDSNPAAGLYRINAGGTGVEVIAVNSQFSAADLGIARTIGIMPMTNYLVWATDTGALPYVCRMHRSQIGLPNPVVEKVYRINSAAWWTVKASDDGSRWVFSATGENPANRIDTVSHLYAVEDEGATVYEIGTIRARKEDTVSIAPVGSPGNHGDVFFMQTHTDAEPGSWKFALGRGSGIAIPWPQRIQVPMTKTFNHGPVSIAAGAEVIFWTETAPARSSVLHLFDIGASASVRCILRINGVDILNTGDRSERVTRDADWGAAFLTHTASGGQTVQVILKNQGGSTVADAKAHITYGWGSGIGIV